MEMGYPCSVPGAVDAELLALACCEHAGRHDNVVVDDVEGYAGVETAVDELALATELVNFVLHAAEDVLRVVLLAEVDDARRDGLAIFDRLYYQWNVQLRQVLFHDFQRAQLEVYTRSTRAMSLVVLRTYHEQTHEGDLVLLRQRARLC